MNNRVVVTGMGFVTPLGEDIDTFAHSLMVGKSGVRKIERFDANRLSSQIAGEIEDFSFQSYIPPKKARKMDRATRLGIVAAKKALEDAKLEITQENEYRIGILVATSLGGIGKLFNFHEKVLEKGPERAAPHYIYSPVEACASYLAIETGIKGVNLTSSAGCASSVNALGMGLILVRSGMFDAILVCGTEMPLVETVMAPFCNSGALSTRNDEPTKASRPFDKHSDGFVMAEGSGAIILENLEHANRRGGRIYAELAGFGTTSDAFSVNSIAPSPQGLVKSMELALTDSKTAIDEVSYINAYANSLHHYDVLESLAIKELFGELAYKIPISATKSMLGHLVGASGIVEVIATIIGMNQDFIPPTINLEEPHGECDLDYVPHVARQQRIKVAVKNSIANANLNSSLIIKRFE